MATRRCHYIGYYEINLQCGTSMTIELGFNSNVLTRYSIPASIHGSYFRKQENACIFINLPAQTQHSGCHCIGAGLSYIQYLSAYYGLEFSDKIKERLSVLNVQCFLS